MRTSLSVVVALSVVALVACTQPAQEPATDDAAARQQADLKAIDELMTQWNALAMEGCEALVTVVTDDYIRLLPNRPALVGKQAFLEVCQENRDLNTFSDLKNVNVEVRLAGDWAYVRGTWTVTRTPKTGGESLQESGNFIDIRERQPDGSWKIARAAVLPAEPRPEGAPE